jgi:Fic family protein
MGPHTPYLNLEPLPPSVEKVETLAVLRQAILNSGAIAELKGIAKIIPNQAILINAVVLQEVKDSSEIENIITSLDELYEAIVSLKIDLWSQNNLYHD